MAIQKNTSPAKTSRRNNESQDCGSSQTIPPQQIIKKMVAMEGLLMDLTIKIKQMESWMQRLADRVSELEKKEGVPLVPPPSDTHCSRAPNGVILYGQLIPLPPDATDVLYHLANTDDIVSTESLALLCTPKNKLMVGKYLLPHTIYQRLRRLKEELNTYHPNLGTACIVSIPRGKVRKYRFDGKQFRDMLGIE